MGSKLGLENFGSPKVNGMYRGLVEQSSNMKFPFSFYSYIPLINFFFDHYYHLRLIIILLMVKKQVKIFQLNNKFLTLNFIINKMWFMLPPIFHINICRLSYFYYTRHVQCVRVHAYMMRE